MKYPFLFIFLLVFCSVKAQIIARPNPTSAGIGYKYIVGDSGVVIGTFPHKPPTPPAYILKEKKGLFAADTLGNYFKFNRITNQWDTLGGGGSGGSSYAPYALDTTITTTGIATVFTIPLPTLATYQLRVQSHSDYIDSLSGSNLIVTFAVAPVGAVNFHISGSFTSTNAIVFKPNFGVLASTASPANDLIAYSNLGISYARYGYAGGSGTPLYYNATNNGYKVILTYNFALSVLGNGTPFPTDTAAFRANLITFLTSKSQTNVIGYCIVNEENNIGTTGFPGYWSGNASQFLALLNICVQEIHKTGKWVANGWLTGDYLAFKTWEDFNSRGFTDSAAAFEAEVLASGQHFTNWRTTTSRQPQIYFIDTLISAYATSGIDYVNYHNYEPQVDTTQTTTDAKAFVSIGRYLQRTTGKQVITNEIGQHNLAPAIAPSVLAACIQLRMPYALWYSGNDLYSLVNQDATLRSNGTAFKNYITSL